MKYSKTTNTSKYIYYSLKKLILTDSKSLIPSKHLSFQLYTKEDLMSQTPPDLKQKFFSPYASIKLMKSFKSKTRKKEERKTERK